MQSSKWVTLIFGALCLMAVAGVMGAQNLYYMAAILLTLPGVSYLLGWYALRGLTFTRELPPACWEGEEGEIVYRVENPTRIPRFFLSLQEVLPDWMESLEETPPFFNIAANESIRVTVRVRFRRRGVFEAPFFEVSAMDPLGVFAFGRSVPTSSEIVVYPSPLPLPAFSIDGMERYGWQNVLLSSLRGNSIDPDGVRRYVTGDPLRRIHWRQTARTGQLSVIEFEESFSLNLILLLDVEQATIHGPENDNTLEYSIRAAASLLQTALTQGASVRLLTGRDNESAAAPPGSGNTHLFELLEVLARVEPGAKPLHEVLAAQAGTVPRGATLLVLTANPDPRIAEALASVAPNQIRTMVLFVDPASFQSRASTHDSLRENEFILALRSCGSQAGVLRREAEGQALLEMIDHGSA